MAPVSELQQVLMERFDFDADDLAANRAGLLSESQRATLTSRRWRWLALAAVLAAASLGVAWAFASNRSRSTAAFRESRGFDPLPYEWGSGVTAGFVLLVLTALPSLFLWWRLDGRPLLRGPRSFTGPVAVVEQRASATVNVDAVRVGTALRGRTIPARPGDDELVRRLPRATLHYNPGFGRTRLYSIEPALTDQTA